MTFSSMKFLSRSVAGATAGTFVLIGLLAAPAAGQYATDVARWVAQDAADPLPGNGIVFAGSSSIRRWEELTRDFADYNVIQRGLGGATFATYQPHVHDTVIAHAPRAVVVWLGTNDIAGGLSGNGVVTAFQTFASTVHASLPDTEIFFLGIMPTPGRQGNRAQENIANAGIAASAAANPRIHYVDLPAAFATLNPYNDPAFTSMFVDSIHLNRAGYDFWESVIRPQLSTVVAPDKVYVPNPATLKIGESLYFDFGGYNRLLSIPKNHSGLSACLPCPCYRCTGRWFNS
jgi:lysophospholipase L1-like esterase